MGKFFTKGRIACLIIFSVLVIDQIIKIWIKTHMYWHESIRITDWFYIYSVSYTHLTLPTIA
mgnify:CR=1 FL=1